jgi:hypothetical protein
MYLFRFDQITGDTDYHCYNWYARSGIAAMQCGDLPGEINNGGCSQVHILLTQNDFKIDKII